VEVQVPEEFVADGEYLLQEEDEGADYDGDSSQPSKSICPWLTCAD
jgi:hypothetical protein